MVTEKPNEGQKPVEQTTGSAAIPPNPVEEKPEKEVKIPQKTLDAILSKLEESNKLLKKQGDEITMLKSVSDKGRMNKWEEQNKGSLIRTANISIWEGNPIIGWHRVKDEVGFRDGRLVVNQTIKIFVDEGKKEPKEIELEYLYWAQNTTSMPGEVVSKNITDKGEVWTLEMKDGRKVALDIRFINAF